MREICSRLRRLLQRGFQKALRFEIVDLGRRLQTNIGMNRPVETAS